jgi:N-acetylglucosamine repressor
VNIFNPHKLFIYGRFLDARADLFALLLERTERRSLAPNWYDCQVVRARGSKRLGAVAAAAHGATHGRNAATA